MSAIARFALSIFGWLPMPIKHFLVGLTSPAVRVGTAVVVEDGHGHVLLVEHSYRGNPGLPGGMLGWREMPQDCARRELREEVGLDVDIETPGFAILLREYRRIIYAYRATIDDPTLAKPTSVEIRSVLWVPKSDIPALDGNSMNVLDVVFGGGTPPAQAR